MKKITSILMIMISIFTLSNAQIASNCAETCEVEKVIQEGAFLGVRIQNMSCTSEFHGVAVRQILPNTAAQKFDFKVADVIVSVNGTEVFTTKELIEVIKSYKPSELVTIVYSRDGKEIEKDVILGARKTRIVKETVCCDGKDALFNDFNMNLYPNPAVSNINFSMEVAEDGKYTFQIFNSIGEEFFVEIESFEAGFSKNINLSDLSSGEYFLKVSKGKKSFTQAFVVSK